MFVEVGDPWFRVQKSSLFSQSKGVTKSILNSGYDLILLETAQSPVAVVAMAVVLLVSLDHRDLLEAFASSVDAASASVDASTDLADLAGQEIHHLVGRAGLWDLENQHRVGQVDPDGLENHHQVGRAAHVGLENHCLAGQAGLEGPDNHHQVGRVDPAGLENHCLGGQLVPLGLKNHRIGRVAHVGLENHFPVGRAGPLDQEIHHQEASVLHHQATAVLVSMTNYWRATAVMPATSRREFRHLVTEATNTD